MKVISFIENNLGSLSENKTPIYYVKKDAIGEKFGIHIGESLEAISKSNPFSEWNLIVDRMEHIDGEDSHIYLALHVVEISPMSIEVDAVLYNLTTNLKMSLGFSVDEEECKALYHKVNGRTFKVENNDINKDFFQGVISVSLRELVDFLKKKTSKEYIEGIDKQRVRFKTKDKRVIKFKGISHLAPYKQGRVIYDPILESSIEWTYAFQVAGHWRKIPGIGKNREGLYNQDGFTWIVPHLRNKDLEHRENIRVSKL